MTAISTALYNTEVEILKANPLGYNENDLKIQRNRHRNKVLEKFYAGQRDEKYVQEYYEILKKADNFLKVKTPHKIEAAAYRHGSNFGMKDQYGRRYEHYGFFDDKHKHAGQTLGEVLALEMEERRTKDDDYELLYIFDNKPIEAGLGKIMNVVEKKDDDESYESIDILKRSKQVEFPIKGVRHGDVDPINKIEHLTEFLHVKRIGFEYVQLEFFIPLKFKTEEIKENTEDFIDITNISSIFVKNIYGDTMYFGINKFKKRIRHNDTHEVWKFEGIEMLNLGQI